jgi:hypothetical protein
VTGSLGVNRALGGLLGNSGPAGKAGGGCWPVFDGLSRGTFRKLVTPGWPVQGLRGTSRQ